MAVVATYEDLGCIVRIHDDKLERDQAAAWAEAYKVAGAIYYRHLREEMDRKGKEGKKAGAIST